MNYQLIKEYGSSNYYNAWISKDNPTGERDILNAKFPIVNINYYNKFNSLTNEDKKIFPLINFREINWSICLNNNSNLTKVKYSNKTENSNPILITFEDFINFINDTHISKGVDGPEGFRGNQGETGPIGSSSNVFSQKYINWHYKNSKQQIQDINGIKTNTNINVTIDKYGHILV